MKTGKVASWISLVLGVLCFLCAAPMLTPLHSVSEYSPLAIPVLILGFIDILLVPALSVVSIVFGIVGYRRGKKGKSIAGIVFASLALLCLVALFCCIYCCQ